MLGQVSRLTSCLFLHRHNALRDTVAHILSRHPFCQPSRCEVILPRFLHTNLPKRVDILVASTPDFHPTGWNPLGLDVTIRCPYARHILSSAALQSSTAPNRGEQQKVGYCKTDCHAEGWDFYPCSFDSFETPGSQTRRLLTMWPQAAASKTGSPPAKECRRLIIRIINAIWQQAALAVNRRRSPRYPFITCYPPPLL